MTHSKRPQVRSKPWATAARTHSAIFLRWSKQTVNDSAPPAENTFPGYDALPNKHLLEQAVSSEQVEDVREVLLDLFQLHLCQMSVGLYLCFWRDHLQVNSLSAP